MFSARLSAADLVTLCRALRHHLAAGLTLVHVLRQQAERGPRSIRSLSARLLMELKAGSSLSDALDREQSALPPLFLAMAKLGEETGQLPEILGELEQYFQLEVQLRRQFRSRAILPVAQFVLAVLIVAGLILILGLVAGTGRPLFTFFGLGGVTGALAFLASVAGVLSAIALIWVAITHGTRQRASADRVLLRIPVLGSCLEALAMGRFTLALQLTLDSGLAIAKGLRLSLRATGNAAYAEAADGVARALSAGRTLHEALAETGLFSEEFLHIVASAEEVGRVPEAMRQQTRHYHEEAERRLRAVAGAASMGLWFVYAGFMVFMIFKIAGVYLAALGI